MYFNQKNEDFLEKSNLRRNINQDFTMQLEPVFLNTIMLNCLIVRLFEDFK